MGRGRHCSEVEKKIIKNLRKKGKTLKKIAETVGRSINFVANAMKEKKMSKKSVVVREKQQIWKIEKLLEHQNQSRSSVQAK